MLKTNSKEVMNKIKKVIMDSYEAAEEYYTFDGGVQIPAHLSVDSATS